MSQWRTGTAVDPSRGWAPSGGYGTVTGGAMAPPVAPGMPSGGQSGSRVAIAPALNSGTATAPLAATPPVSGQPPFDINAMLARYRSGVPWQSSQPGQLPGQPWGMGRNALAGPWAPEQPLTSGWGQAGAIGGINNLRALGGGS